MIQNYFTNEKLKNFNKIKEKKKEKKKKLDRF